MMIEVYRDRDSATIGHLQSVLEAEGIRTYLRNEHASSTTIPIPEVTPALCILEEDQVGRAVELIRSYLDAPQAAQSRNSPAHPAANSAPAP